jgi:hypothetical protein
VLRIAAPLPGVIQACRKDTKLYRANFFKQRITHRLYIRRQWFRFEFAQRELVFLNTNDFRAYGLSDLVEPLFELSCVLGNVLLRIDRQF